MIGRNVVTREIDAIENRALDWVRDNDQLVFAGVSLHLEDIRESMEHGNSRLMAIVDVLGTQWSNGPPGFTDRDTVLDTMAMAMLASGHDASGHCNLNLSLRLPVPACRSTWCSFIIQL